MNKKLIEHKLQISRPNEAFGLIGGLYAVILIIIIEIFGCVPNPANLFASFDDELFGDKIKATKSMMSFTKNICINQREESVNPFITYGGNGFGDNVQIEKRFRTDCNNIQVSGEKNPRRFWEHYGVINGLVVIGHLYWQNINIVSNIYFLCRSLPIIYNFESNCKSAVGFTQAPRRTLQIYTEKSSELLVGSLFGNIILIIRDDSSSYRYHDCEIRERTLVYTLFWIAMLIVAIIVGWIGATQFETYPLLKLLLVIIASIIAFLAGNALIIPKYLKPIIDLGI